MMPDRIFPVPAGATRRHGIALACTSVLLFSSFAIASRLGLSTRLSPIDVAALRFGISGLLMAPVLLRHGLCGLHAGQALGLSLLGGLAFALLAYAGFKLAPVAHSAILLHGTLSLTTALLGWPLAAVGSRRTSSIGLAAIVTGIGTAAWQGVAHASPSLLLGDFCLLLASFCWSGYGLYLRHLQVPAPNAAAIVAGLSALIFLPVYLLLPGPHLSQAGWPDLLIQGGFQGVLIGTVSIFVYSRAVSLLGPVEVSLFTTAVPAVTAMAGFMLLGERPALPILAGIALVTLGAVLSLRTQIRTCVPISTTRLEGMEK